MKYILLIISLTIGSQSFAQRRIVPYKVLEGDWIYKILRSFKKETKQRIINQILNLNPQVSNADLIYPGQTLLVPIAFKRAVEKDWSKRGIRYVPAPAPKPLPPKKIYVEKIVKSKPEVIIKETVRKIYLEEVKKEHFLTFSPIYSYSRLDYDSNIFGATAVSKVNWGTMIGYSERTGQHWTNYSFEFNKFKYQDKSSGLDNKDFFNVAINFEKAWRKGLFEFAPGFNFGQYHYLQDNPVTKQLDFFKETQPGLTFRIALRFATQGKDFELGLKTNYLFSATAKNIEIKDSFLNEAYVRFSVKLNKIWLIDFTPSYRYQTTRTSEAEHIFQHLSFRVGFIYHFK